MTQSLVIGIAVVVIALAVWIGYLVVSRRTRRSGLAPADADAAREAERAGDAAVSTAMANRIREGRRGV